MSGSTSWSKNTFILALPLLLAVEVMYVIPSTPLICSSMGTITLSSTVAAFAPGKFAVTWTVGGAISGYWVVGSAEIPKTPNINMIMESTLDRTGRSINFLIIGDYLLFEYCFYSLNDAVKLHGLCYNRHIVPQLAHAFGNNFIARRNAVLYHNNIVHPVKDIYGACGGQSVALYFKHISYALSFKS